MRLIEFLYAVVISFNFFGFDLYGMKSIQIDHPLYDCELQPRGICAYCEIENSVIPCSQCSEKFLPYIQKVFIKKKHVSIFEKENMLKEIRFCLSKEADSLLLRIHKMPQAHQKRSIFFRDRLVVMGMINETLKERQQNLLLKTYQALDELNLNDDPAEKKRGCCCIM